jgi:trans-aconitate methyltransferase
MWYPHQIRINIYPSHQVSFKSWATSLKLTHGCMNVHIPNNDDNTIHLLMNNRLLIPINPSQFASSHIIISSLRYTFKQDTTTLNILVNHKSSSSVQINYTYISISFPYSLKIQSIQAYNMLQE